MAIPERTAVAERAAVREHTGKALIAAGETAVFAVGGLIYPPLFAGAAVTGIMTIKETSQTITAFRQIASIESKP